MNPAIAAALRLLDAANGQPLDPAQVEPVRAPLGGEARALFDRALELRQAHDALHHRVLRSAVFAEASLGTAAFIHELRQCLSPVIGLAELLKESPRSPFVNEWVAEISGQAVRLADLLDRHAALLRTHAGDEEPCELAAVAVEAARYFSRLPPGVKLVIDLPAELPHALARRRQLLHALINLIANARDAHKGRAGTISLTARVREPEHELELLICDQGAGIDPAIRDRLFEPLFTTKKEDGTGLGLFLSRELLRPRGTLVLLDGPDVPEGARTAFAIRLPRAAPTPSSAAARLAETVQVAPAGEQDAWASARRKAYERAAPLLTDARNHPVLLVEDEPAVRRMTKAVLESVANLKIYEAADAALALALLEKYPIDFLVCDKNLPDQDGLEVIRRARERHPSIDAMIVTGYPSPESVAEAIRMGATDYLLKPVREIRTLRESVSTALTRQKLQRLADRHGGVWAELVEELRRAAPPAAAERLGPIAAHLHSDGDTTPSPRLALLGGDGETRALLEAAGLSLVRLEQPADLEAHPQDVDLVVFPAEDAPERARQLLAAAKARTTPPHLVAIGRFAYTETAVAAIQGRTGVILDRGASASVCEAALIRAVARRRLEVRALALGQLLREIGFNL